MPRISIITVCLNNIEGLRITRDSISEQEFRDFEWIVIDGDSHDGSKEFLYSIQNEVTFISEPDQGIYDAMNKGVNIAIGDYLIFLNAGDYFYNDYVLKKTNDLNADLVIGWLNIIKDENKSKNNNIKRVDNQDVRKKFLFHRSIPHQATFVRREVFEKYGLYDVSFKICGDHDFFARIILAGATLKYVCYPIASFPLNGLSSELNGSEVFINEIRKIRKNNFSLMYRVWRRCIDTIEKKMHLSKVQRDF